MDKPMPNFVFKVMILFFNIRDWFRPRKIILDEVEIKTGFHILDFGCGTGSYTQIVSALTGETGKVYALDIHPLSINRIQKMASASGFKNIETICSDGDTGLANESMDVILLYDIFHMLENQDKVLKELSRVLKTNGILSFSDHHMKDREIVSLITKNNLFQLVKKGKFTYSFAKI
jgi:ubiquinone/menaquinone biosynthesis C-methylase UbiE